MKEPKNIEDQLMEELAENGTDKARALFLEWQQARIDGKTRFLSKLEQLENKHIAKDLTKGEGVDKEFKCARCNREMLTSYGDNYCYDCAEELDSIN